MELKTFTLQKEKDYDPCPNCGGERKGGVCPDCDGEEGTEDASGGLKEGELEEEF